MALKLAPKRFASSRCGQRQFFRPHVVRRRIDEVAGERRRIGHSRDIGDVDALGRHQPDIGRIVLAVAAEAVAAEREGQRGKARCHAAHWQNGRRPAAAGRARRPAGTGRGICWLHPRDRTAPARCCRPPPAASGRPRAWRQNHWPARTAGPRRASAGADRIPCRLGRKGNGNGGRGRRGLEHGWHAGSRLPLEAGAVDRKRRWCQRAVNQTLGLTVYCWRVRLGR